MAPGAKFCGRQYCIKPYERASVTISNRLVCYRFLSHFATRVKH